MAHSWRPHTINASRNGGVADTIPFNNAAERGLRGIALARRNWTFAGSDDGGRRAAAVYSLIETKLNDVDPRAWLADILVKLPDHPAQRIGELMPWAWKAHSDPAARATTAVAA